MPIIVPAMYLDKLGLTRFTVGVSHDFSRSQGDQAEEAERRDTRDWQGHCQKQQVTKKGEDTAAQLAEIIKVKEGNERLKGRLTI